MAEAGSYPMARSAGMFLTGVGTTLLLATALAEPARGPVDPRIFALGFILSVALLVVRALRLGTVRPTRAQRLAMWFAVALEAALFAAKPIVLGPMPIEQTWMVGLAIVGIHFVPFGIALGPACALMGLLCTANAVVALSGWAPPAVWLGIDSALKIGFGLWMCLPRTPLRPLQPAA